ncbi:MAG: CBS domain-containing protein [Thermodesulfobacteriota bacterium]
MPKTTLRKIEKKTVISTGPGDSVKTAAMLMREKMVGSVVIVENKRPIGIITDRDITVRVVADGLDVAKTKVREVMTGELITANEDTRAAELLKVIDENGIRRVPIVDKNGHLSGIITLDDLLQIVGINVGVKMKLT